MVIVSDTSCLILFSKIDELDLLQKMYGQVFVTPEVLSEFKLVVPPWILVESPLNNNFQAALEKSLDKGEASAIALAFEKPNPLLLIDEQKGRRIAKELGIQITGSLGIILAAKQMGLINSAGSILDKIKSTNFRISPSLEAAVRKAAYEL